MPASEKTVLIVDDEPHVVHVVRLKLEQAGFRRFCCDDLIEEQLDTKLLDAAGRRQSMGEWMGLPCDPHYREREAEYLALESDTLREVLDEIDQADTDLVVDTTGSVIYLEDELLRRLREQTLVVHLETPKEAQQRLCEKFFREPTPMIWRSESVDFSLKDRDSLIASYPLLLESREAKYRQLSRIALDFFERRREGFGVGELLRDIRERASAQGHDFG